MIISQETIKALKAEAIIQQKEGTLFTVRLSVTGGRLTADELGRIARLAADFADAEVHLTTRQGVEIPNVPYEKVDAIRAAVAAGGFRPAPAGRCVRSITACPGLVCRFGQIDSQAVARELHGAVGGRGNLPHKFKIAVTGCPNACTKPIENDFGVMGTAQGYVLYVGGKMGKKPRLATRLPLRVPDVVGVLQAVSTALDWYASHGTPGERFGATIDRVGIASLLSALGQPAEAAA